LLVVLDHFSLVFIALCRTQLFAVPNSENGALVVRKETFRDIVAICYDVALSPGTNKSMDEDEEEMIETFISNIVSGNLCLLINKFEFSSSIPL
jgi:hypothetical protein